MEGITDTTAIRTRDASPRLDSRVAEGGASNPRAHGDMYDWVDGTINPLAGECPHRCQYCYVQSLRKRYPKLKEKYSGDARYDFTTKWPKHSGTYFLCSCNDLFAEEIPRAVVGRILWEARQHNGRYVLQTKNPSRMFAHFDHEPFDRAGFIFGVTIETNRATITNQFSKAPTPFERVHGEVDFVTIEPIMKFDLPDLVSIIRCCKPKWVNIGADSKRSGLPEPTAEEVWALIAELERFTTVHLKKNLARIVGDLRAPRSNRKGGEARTANQSNQLKVTLNQEVKGNV